MKTYLLPLFLSILVMLVACGTTEDDQTADKTAQGDDQAQIETPAGDNNTNNKTGDDHADDANNTNTNENTDQNPNQDDMLSKMEELNYTDFELDIEYANNETYEAELKTEKQHQRIDVEIDDDLNGVRLERDEAFDILYPLVAELNINQDTSKEDTIADVLKVFNLPENYKKFEIEITFRDGPTMEYEDKK